MEQPFQIAQPELRSLPKYLLLTMRPKQWIKNVFVFAGLVFANDLLLTNLSKIVIVLAAFALWCLAASSVYLINDLADIQKDREHPKKRNRPLASGHLAPAAAVAATVVF